MTIDAGNDDSKQRWLRSEGGRDRVKELISESGAPLEASISRLCQRFATAHDGADGCIIRTEPLIYGADLDRPLREVDQLLSFYQEVAVGDRLGVQLVLQVPIEAKTRRGVELFGITVAEQPVAAGALPIAGDLGQSGFVRRDVASVLPAHMQSAMIKKVASLKFKDDGSPQSVADENLVYKATAALYDFILESAGEENHPDSLSCIEGSALFRKFEKQVEGYHSVPEPLVRRWIESQAHEEIRKYVDAVTGGTRVYRMLEIFCPLVCIDRPMCDVSIDGLGELSDFDPCEWMTTSARILGWRSGLGSNLARRGPEAVTTIVTLAGLEAALPGLLEFFSSVRSKLDGLDQEAADRAVFEHDFIRAFRRRLPSSSSYRSDLDMDEF